MKKFHVEISEINDFREEIEKILTIFWEVKVFFSGVRKQCSRECSWRATKVS